MPVLIALTQWGDKWVFGEGSEPVIFRDREFEEPIAKMEVSSARGQHFAPSRNHGDTGARFDA